MTARRVGVLAGGAMLAVYAATLAPSVTFWDAGEFIASAHALGIPHPPGTPLFVVLLNVWARALSIVPAVSFAAATNFLSAVCTALAVGLTAWLVARHSSSPWIGVSAVTAGAMTSVWQNATETEVYAASLGLAVVTLVAAEVAGRTGERRWLALTAYCIALAVPLHLSALVAAPAAIYLAAKRADRTVDWTGATMLLAAAVATFGASHISLGWLVAAAALFIAAPLAAPRASRSAEARRSVSALAATAIALSCTLFLLIRARHDPAINQGNPATWSALGDVIARRQYDVPGLWPRQAPFWLQLANWFEYADWQFALSLAPTVIPSIARVAATLVFATLGVIGMRWQRERDHRTWAALMILFVSGSLGVLIYLNLKAGSSFAWGLLPRDTAHEARDRDYFFVLGFWAWGVWAGLGAFSIANRLRLPRPAAALVAALPIFLNWSAVTRRAEPEAILPRAVASALLDSLPRNTVLFVAGDNDTYPLWYAQQVENRRRDVTVVTWPLLAAPWYVTELSRRHGLRTEAFSDGRDARTNGISATLAAAVARAATARGRSVAVALTLSADERAQLNKDWIVSGVYALMPPATGQRNSVSEVVAIDTQRVRGAKTAIDSWLHGRVIRPSTDPTTDSFLRTLSCPSLILDRAKSPAPASLDSTCNLR